MRTAALALAGTFVCLVLAGCSDPEPMRMAFTPFDPNLLAVAQSEGKPAVVFATADWCGPCQRLRKGALSDPKVVAELEKFVRLKIDGTDRGDSRLPPLLARHGIASYPTLIFFGRDGTEAARLGLATTDEVLAAADQALSR